MEHNVIQIAARSAARVLKSVAAFASQELKMQQRKKYTKEFKLDAVSLVNDQGYTRIEASRSLGNNANMLGRWVKEFNQDEDQAFRGNGKLTAEQENRRLREENKRLKMEKEILKKATVFFAKETK